MTDLAASIDRTSRSENSLTRFVVELAIFFAGVICVATAIGANQRWLDAHFLPSFLLPRGWFTLIETSVRIAMGALGAWLATSARRRAGRFTSRYPSLTIQIVVAIVAALAASEFALARTRLQPGEWLFPDEEPRRVADAYLGWTFVPSRTGHLSVGGRDVSYTFDAHGYRVRSLDEPVDLERRTLVFAGESVMVGEGLTWDESVPARVGDALGVQSANIAVHGYSTDQVYMRIERELPRFREPAAVVILFMPELFGRNLDRDRPYLEPGLMVWRPARQRARLASLAQIFVPYRSTATVDRGVAMTREVLRRASALAVARRATPLVVVPQFGDEDERSLDLRRRIFDGSGVAYEVVRIDPAWRIPWDRHPDARAARVIADAITARLKNY